MPAILLSPVGIRITTIVIKSYNCFKYCTMLHHWWYFWGSFFSVLEFFEGSCFKWLSHKVICLFPTQSEVSMQTILFTIYALWFGTLSEYSQLWITQMLCEVRITLHKMLCEEGIIWVSIAVDWYTRAILVQ